jgi:cytochrome b pre-mRNA-processing protein 3
MVLGLFRKDTLREPTERLYEKVAAAARQPELFAVHGVPDTVEGRFEALALHVFLITRRLDQLGENGSALAQSFIDRFFLDLDGAVRVIGIGDLSVGKKVKAYARNFYGRVEAYGAGLLPGAEPDRLEDAVWRNLLGAADDLKHHAPALSGYMRKSAERLAALDLPAIQSAATLFAEEALA